MVPSRNDPKTSSMHASGASDHLGLVLIITHALSYSHLLAHLELLCTQNLYTVS